MTFNDPPDTFTSQGTRSNLPGIRLLLDKGVHLEQRPKNSTHCGQNNPATCRKVSRSPLCIRKATSGHALAQHLQTRQCRKDSVDRSWQKAFFPFGGSCNADQILSLVGRHGWNNICIRLSRHLGGEHSAKPVTLRAQPAETTFEVDANTDSTIEEADPMDMPIKVKQQLACSATMSTLPEVFIGGWISYARYDTMRYFYKHKNGLLLCVL